MKVLFAIYFLHNQHFGLIDERMWHNLYKQGLCIEVYASRSAYVQTSKENSPIMICELK